MTAVVPRIEAKHRLALAAAVMRARKHPIPWEKLCGYGVPCGEPGEPLRNPNRPPSELVVLTPRFFVAVSVEEQPAGMFLSIALVDRERTPSPEAVALIAQVFGIDIDEAISEGRMWREPLPWLPGVCAVSLALLIEPGLQEDYS